MDIDTEIPFVPNAEDDRHCYSATLSMIVASFVPDLPPKLEVGNRIAGKRPGRTEWPIAAPLWLQRNGFDIEVIFDFDYPAVARDGIEYIRARYGDEVADWQAINTNIPSKATVSAFLAEIPFQQRTPEFEDVIHALEAGLLVTVSVNSACLRGEDGYVAHYVVVKGMTDTEVILHNPGLPPMPNQHVAIDRFVEAWSWPSADARYMMTVGRSLERAINVEALRQFAEFPENQPEL